MELHRLTASAAAALIAQGKLTVEEFTRALLGRIAERDATIRAWSAIDPDLAVRRARELDKVLIDRGPLGPLHGIAMGVKDIIATADFPTTQNSPLYDGFRPSQDAGSVRIARACGALIMGKTDTVEFAAGGRKALTRNPHDLSRTPGGSSSGSAAAVADFHVPLAFGTQTAGSLIRPASYNGIYALKPTHNAVPWFGAAQAAPTLDTIGWYGRSVADLALVASAFRLPGLAKTPSLTVRGMKVGYARTHNWGKVEASARDAMDKAAKRLGAAGAEVRELELGSEFAAMNEHQSVVMEGEGMVHFLADYLESRPRLHADFVRKVENARGITPEQLVAALDGAALCRIAFDRLFDHAVDVVLTPAATGEAPKGLASTGDWVMNSMWTLLHVPCIAIPVHVGPAGCPVGIQIVGRRFGDARLLAIAEAIGPIIDRPE